MELHSSTNLSLPKGLVRTFACCSTLGTYITSIAPSCTFFHMNWCCNSMCLVLACRTRYFTNFRAFWLSQSNNVCSQPPHFSSWSNDVIQVISLTASVRAQYSTAVLESAIVGYSWLIQIIGQLYCLNIKPMVDLHLSKSLAQFASA